MPALFGRLMGVAGILGMAIATILTVRPEVLRLSDLLGQGYRLDVVLHDAKRFLRRSRHVRHRPWWWRDWLA